MTRPVTLGSVLGLVLAAVFSVGCASAKLLYPGDEQRELPSGQGLVAIGQGSSIQLYTVEFCGGDGGPCLIAGPFMETQDVYLVRMPAGEQCVTNIHLRHTGDIEGGGSGTGFVHHAESGCFTVGDGQVTYIGSLDAQPGGLKVEHRNDIHELLLRYYPALKSGGVHTVRDVR